MENQLFYLDNGYALKVKEGRYEKEADLQKIVEDNPNLIARNWSIGRERKLYLVNREQSVFISEDDGTSYSLDHLLVDDEGIPVLVEVKRSTDTRIRREVIAQMLDYACGAANWDTMTLKRMFEKNNEDISESFDDSFWNTVESNLRAGKMRLVFVADQIPETLRVLIEFMDKTMQNIEVYGVELKPYRNGDVELLSKNVIGNSFLTNPKPETTRMTWTLDMFIEKMEGSGLADQVETLKEIVDFATEELKLSMVPGAGAVSPSVLLKTDTVTVMYIYLRFTKGKETACYFEFSVRDLANYCRMPVEKIKEVLQDYPGVEVNDMKQLIWETDNWDHIDLGTLDRIQGIEQFKENLREVIELIGDNSGVWDEEAMKTVLSAGYGVWGIDFFDQVKSTAAECGYLGKYSYNRDYVPYLFSYNGKHIFSFTARKSFGSLAFNSDAVSIRKEELIGRICDIDPEAMSYINPKKMYITLRFNAIRDGKKEAEALQLLRDIRPETEHVVP